VGCRYLRHIIIIPAAEGKAHRHSLFSRKYSRPAWSTFDVGEQGAGQLEKLDILHYCGRQAMQYKIE